MRASFSFGLRVSGFRQTVTIDADETRARDDGNEDAREVRDRFANDDRDSHLEHEGGGHARQ